MKVGIYLQTCTLVALISFISACAVAKKTYLSDGSEGFSISCDGAAVGINVCFEKAGSLCGAAGYSLINREGQVVPYGVATVSGGQAFVNYGSFNTKSIMIRCNTSSAVSFLTQDQLLINIVGNTLTGKTNSGMKWAEYYELSKGEERKGKIRGAGTKLYSGQWEINGSLMCFDYEGSTDDGCWKIALNRDTLTWYKPNGDVAPPSSTLIPGNPNNF